MIRLNSDVEPSDRTGSVQSNYGESYLVIGGNGSLGREIVKQLLDRTTGSDTQADDDESTHTQNVKKARVSILDLREVPRWDERICHMWTGDITVLEDVVRAVEGNTIIIHTASPIHGLPSHVYDRVNVHGTANIILACQQAGARKLIYTSSASVVFDGSDLCGADETIPYCRIHMDAYNASKAAAERLVLEANGRACIGGGRLLTCALRPSGIFGPGDAQGSLAMAQAAASGKWRVAIGDNSNLFDMTYVDNAAYSHVLAADRLAEDNGTAGQAFNITNDHPMFFWDFAKKLYDELGYRNGTLGMVIPKSVGFGMGWCMDVLTNILKPVVTLHPSFTTFRVKIITANRYFDISKAKKYLGYVPPVGMEEAIKRTAAYWKPEYGCPS